VLRAHERDAASWGINFGVPGGTCSGTWKNNLTLTFSTI